MLFHKHFGSKHYQMLTISLFQPKIKGFNRELVKKEEIQLKKIPEVTLSFENELS